MTFNSLYLSVLKSPGWLSVSNKPLQIDWSLARQHLLKTHYVLFTYSAIRACTFLIHTDGKVLAKEESIVLALFCPMISNIHLWNTSENFCPLVASVVNLEREKVCVPEVGNWVLILLAWDTPYCVFEEQSKIPKVSLLKHAVYFLKLLLTVNWLRYPWCLKCCRKGKSFCLCLAEWVPTSLSKHCLVTLIQSSSRCDSWKH